MPTPVTVRRTSLRLPTYEPHAPDPNPMFLEKRVYQGSSGRVYPLPCTDRIAATPKAVKWQAVYLENEYLVVMILPELGGRIHRILDKTNGYDAIYHQPVIKPALVGLTGPWCSGGIEFNWPQHHRPSTFMPTDVAIERHPDGSATVWLGEHDPMARMKGMHGVRLHPGRSLVELRARAYNRTTDVQTFLWWANVATRVHEGYQSFFPPDTTYVADHAKRATTTFPHANGHYYGVDYATRGRKGVPRHETPAKHVPPHAISPVGSALGRADSPAIPSYRPDDLSWYANIPVPTSYMCMGSVEDFCGGYDHKARAGVIHIADHHVSPGKKQWTWGNHEFGYAWDRNLTDPDENGEYAPYIELMAGVYTDNQPDFSYLQPGETKTWSQYWYPFREIGPAQHANTEAAVNLALARGSVQVGVAVTAEHPDARVQLLRKGSLLQQWSQTLSPGSPGRFHFSLRSNPRLDEFAVKVLDRSGQVLLDYTPKEVKRGSVPAPATEPAAPADIKSNDELYLVGLHLEQYRHATRMPDLYWREALRRDPGDSRCHLALGRWHLRRGELEAAEQHLRASIARLTSRNPNPADGEAYYQLGRCLQQQWLALASRFAPEQARANAMQAGHALRDEARATLHKATWNHAWQAAGYHSLAELDCCRADWTAALDHLDRALRLNADNLRARNLKAIALQRLGRMQEADAVLAETLALDPLDWWAHHLAGKPLSCDNQVRLDLAHDCARAGLYEQGLEILRGATTTATPRPDGSLGTEPLVHYTSAWLNYLLVQDSPKPDRSLMHTVRRQLRAASRANQAYCFPARLEEISILRFALAANPRDAQGHFHLGNLLYDRRRHPEAIACWEAAARIAPGHAMAWRNLGIAYHNVLRKPLRAKAAYERACKADPRSARYLYERDQLWKRLGVSPARRLAALKRKMELVRQRDDLSVEFCALCNLTGDHRLAGTVLANRRFQPWEGGEGQALGQHVRTHLALGRQALQQGDARAAANCFKHALTAPENLGESRHLLANGSDIHYWLGRAHAALGEDESARHHWTLAAEFKGDFQNMSVRAFSEMTYFSALSLRELGRIREAEKLLRELHAYAVRLSESPATIDYFATSLPTMLLFDDDLQARQATTAVLLEGQALLGFGRTADGKARLRQVLRRDPSHELAADLLRS